MWNSNKPIFIWKYSKQIRRLLWTLFVDIHGHILLLKWLVLLTINDVALIGHQGWWSSAVCIWVHWHLHIFEVRLYHSSYYNVSSYFCVFVIIGNKFELNLVRIIISQMWELDLEKSIILSHHNLLSTLVTCHLGLHSNVAEWVGELGVNYLSDNKGVLWAR